MMRMMMRKHKKAPMEPSINCTLTQKDFSRGRGRWVVVLLVVSGSSICRRKGWDEEDRGRRTEEEENHHPHGTYTPPAMYPHLFLSLPFPYLSTITRPHYLPPLP